MAFVDLSVSPLIMAKASFCDMPCCMRHKTRVFADSTSLFILKGSIVVQFVYHCNDYNKKNRNLRTDTFTEFCNFATCTQWLDLITCTTVWHRGVTTYWYPKMHLANFLLL